jgi:FAD/FMN-containing dehydrogenase/Fe-S oxidoreductase
VRGEVSFDYATLGLYSTDSSIYQIKPVAVVVPRDEEDVLAAMRVAREHGVSILPRGGGTSLGGQAVGESMILDFTKYMDNILELNVAERWVRVQPGVILDELNAALAPHGLQFGPDPATSDRAAIGGMMGNNSSGTKSIVYRVMVDHVLASKVALSDGTVLELTELSGEEYDARCNGPGSGAREAEVYRGFRRIIEANRDEILKRYPKIMRHVQGYNLDAFVKTDRWNLSKLIVGSEGTLAVILEAKLNLVPLPKCKIVCVPHFADLLEAIRTVQPILAYGPSAVEILDADVIGLARSSLGIAPLCGFIQGDPAAVLIVEFFGETPEEVAEKAEKLAADLEGKELGYAWPIIADAGGQADVWAVRADGLGILLGMKGERKPTAFIEDCAVPVEVLPEYIDRTLKFCHQRGVPVAMYGHVSVGVIHVRPILDLKKQEDIDHMKAISEHALGMVKEYGGSWCGEHGDGRVRSPLLEKYFGSQVYGAFREIKRLFDPAGLMNPGPIIDPGPMDENLRFGPSYETPAPTTEYHYREDGAFAAAIEMCSGVAACRQRLAGTMCPSYRVTRDEEHSTRGRANALRLAMTGQLDAEGLTSRRLYEIMDLCLSCKACKSECPSNVDLARLKSEFLQRYHDAHGAGLRERFVAHSTRMARFVAGWKAPLVNWVQSTLVFRKMLEWLAGFDSRRPLPTYARTPLVKWFARHRNGNGNGVAGARTVVLFDDTYMNYHQTSVGISAVELLESCGYNVVLARAGCCQRPSISHGFLRKARREGEKTLRNLDAFIQKHLPVVVCEPGCASALVDDLPDLIEDEALGRRIKDNVLMIDEFLAREVREGRLDCQFTSPFEKVLIHGHCHQKSLFGTSAMKELLGRVAGMSVQEVDSGCCGMAGSFGYEKEHYDLSLAIGEQRLFPAIRSREEGTAVVACGFSCRHQIADGTGVKALHWVETIRGRLQDPAAGQ